MFDAAPVDLFKQPSNQRIGRRIVKRMHELQKEGFDEKAIAHQLKVAVSTVRRHIQHDPSA
jgi:DNA-binding NarL/FixJ family response regulator